jgi:hypothetical protein
VTPTNRSDGASVFNSVSFWTKQTASCAIQCSKNGSNSFFTDSLQASHFNCEKAEKSPGMKTRPSRGNSLDISKAKTQSGMSEFDPSQGSQPVTQPERVSPYWLKVPHIIGFSRNCPKSLVSGNRQPWREFAESLQPKPQKFPFSWRRLAETGSSTTEWSARYIAAAWTSFHSIIRCGMSTRRSPSCHGSTAQ